MVILRNCYLLLGLMVCNLSLGAEALPIGSGHGIAISSTQAEIFFGLTNSTHVTPSFIPSDLPLLSLPQGNHPLVQTVMDKYTTLGAKSWINEVLYRGRLFRPFVIKELEAAGLPLELQWVIFIESEYRPRAVSRSGARGLWQFMPNSVGTSMRINNLVDERQDFIKSTRAAIEKLKFNYSRTKDWYLALAAYNAGLGRVQRAMGNRSGENFWSLVEKKLLPDETINYVPKFIAIAMVGSHLVRSGLGVSWEDPIHWSLLTVPGSIDIELLSIKAQIPSGLLLDGNAELLLGETLGETMGWQLKVPSIYVDAITSVLENEKE